MNELNQAITAEITALQAKQSRIKHELETLVPESETARLKLKKSDLRIADLRKTFLACEKSLFNLQGRAITVCPPQEDDGLLVTKPAKRSKLLEPALSGDDLIDFANNIFASMDPELKDLVVGMYSDEIMK